MKREPCTAAHQVLRSTDVWFTLRLVGTQHTPEDDEGPAEDLELRDCACGSTLARVVKIYPSTKENL